MARARTSQVIRQRLLIVALLLAGAALRLLAVGEAPPGLYHDEAQHGLDALNVLQGEFPLYFAANNGREPLFIYLVAASVGLLGRSPLAVRLPSFFIGFLTLAATYDLARVLFGRRVGRWALAVLAATFWHVHLSRVGFRAVLLPLFTALWLAQATRGMKTGGLRHWIAAGTLYGLSWYTYMAARFTPAAVAALLGYVLWSELRQVRHLRSGGLRLLPAMARSFLFEREPARRFWRGFLVFCAAALVVLLPLGLYTLRHPDVVLQRTGQVSVFSPEINQGNVLRALLDHTWRTAAMFFVQGDRIWRHNLAWRPVWDPALGLAFVIGLGVALSQFRNHAGAALVIVWTVIMALPTLLAEDAPHFLRGSGVLPVVGMLPALGLAWLDDRLRSWMASPASRRIAKALPILLLLLGLASTTFDYFLRFAEAPLAYHWFEAGPAALAGEINALAGVGWNGERMLSGPPTGRQVYVDALFWEEWSAVPFLVPEANAEFLPLATPPDLTQPMTFVVWPYRDWQPEIMPHLPHPAYLGVTVGPQAQGDKDPEPFTLALIVQAEPLPEIPEEIGYFDDGVRLRAALVKAGEEETLVRIWWDAYEPPAYDYTVFIHYLRDGEQIAQHDGPPGYGYLPTTFWETGDLISDIHPLNGVIPDPDRDMLRIGLYRSDTGDPLSLLDMHGNPAGTWIVLDVILDSP
ncbi:MAG: glycosyltransferase family 39 protein [Anaerolineae bacterium]|nr:glycosyltransferase family 39 protein [Anaerolineae bacterium]